MFFKAVLVEMNTKKKAYMVKKWLFNLHSPTSSTEIDMPKYLDLVWMEPFSLIFFDWHSTKNADTLRKDKQQF